MANEPNRNKYNEALSNWLTLNELVQHYTVEELEELLALEQAGQKRKTFLTRIHQRIVRLRGSSERKDLMENSSAKNNSSRLRDGED